MARVRLICVSDRPGQLMVLIHALNAQTMDDWALTVCDQSIGSDSYHVLSETGWDRDNRIAIELVDRFDDWGQTAKWRESLDSDEECLGFPADDAYYAPVYLERMVAALDAGNDLVYCDWVYDANGYQPVMPVEPRVGLIDVGGFLVRRSVLLDVGWDDRGHEGDGKLVERIVANGYKHARVPGLLYVKN